MSSQELPLLVQYMYMYMYVYQVVTYTYNLHCEPTNLVPPLIIYLL